MLLYFLLALAPHQLRKLRVLGGLGKQVPGFLDLPLSVLDSDFVAEGLRKEFFRLRAPLVELAKFSDLLLKLVSLSALVLVLCLGVAHQKGFERLERAEAVGE